MTNSKALRKLVESRGLKYKYIAGQIGITPYCLARKIDARMSYCGLSQGDLARKAGMDPSTLSRRLKDPRRLTLGELESLHRVLHLDLAMILPMFGASKKELMP